MSLDQSPAIETAEVSLPTEQEYPPIRWQQDVIADNKYERLQRTKALAKIGYAAFVGLSLFQLSSCYSVGHEENEVEAQISEQLEEEVRKYRDTAEIVTHCRNTSEATIPPFSFLPSVLDGEGTNGWATLSPKSILPFTEIDYTQVVNIKPEKCDDISASASSRIQLLYIGEGVFELKDENEAELNLYKHVERENATIRVSRSLYKEMQAWHTAYHEAGHSAFDITDEACTDIVGEKLLRSAFADRAKQNNIPAGIMDAVIDEVIAMKDLLDLEAYKNANCDTPLEDLLR